MQWSPAGSARLGFPGSAPNGAAGSGSSEYSCYPGGKLWENYGKTMKNVEKTLKSHPGVALGDWGPTSWALHPPHWGTQPAPGAGAVPVSLRNLGFGSHFNCKDLILLTESPEGNSRGAHLAGGRPIVVEKVLTRAGEITPAMAIITDPRASSIGTF